MNLPALLASLAPVVGFLEEHSDLFELLFNAITSGGLTKSQAVEAIKQALVAAADAEIKREFPNG